MREELHPHTQDHPIYIFHSPLQPTPPRPPPNPRSVSVVEPAYVKSEIFGKIEKDTSFHHLYGHVVPDEEFSRQCQEKASEPTVTSDAILHALVDPYPRTRYVRGWGGGGMGSGRDVLFCLWVVVWVDTKPSKLTWHLSHTHASAGGGQRERQACRDVRVAEVGAERPAAGPAGAVVAQAAQEGGVMKEEEERV